MIVIKTKNKDYSGEISGIIFINGVGKVEKLSKSDKEWFMKYGHEVTKEETENKK